MIFVKSAHCGDVHFYYTDYKQILPASVRRKNGKISRLNLSNAFLFAATAQDPEKILCQANIAVLDDWIVLAANATSIEEFISKTSI